MPQNLPPLEYFIAACVVVAVMGLIGLAVIIKFGRNLVKNVSSIVTTEIAKQAQPAPVNIQTPLEVTQHPGTASRVDLETVKNELHGRIKRERAEINDEIRRVESTAKERVDVLSSDLKQNTALTMTMSGQVQQINQNVHLILTSLSQPK